MLQRVALLTASRPIGACHTPVPRTIHFSDSRFSSGLPPEAAAAAEAAGMDGLNLAAFEQRAAQAEARLAVLEGKLLSGAASLSGSATEELQGLRALLVRAREEVVKALDERDKAVAQAKALEDENARLKYRVMHLSRAVREGDEKLKAATAAAAAGSAAQK